MGHRLPMAIAAGDVLLECLPFVHVLKHEFRGHRCDYCFTECPRPVECECKATFYCNSNCRINDLLDGHKFDCRLLSTKSSRQPNPPIDTSIIDVNLYRLLIRFATRVTREENVLNRTFEVGIVGKVIKISDLKDHYEEIVKDDSKITAIKHLSKQLRRCGFRIELKNLIQFYGQVSTNFVTMEESGIGIYPQLAAFEHDCRPNCCYVIKNSTKLQLRAISDFDSSREPIKLSLAPILKNRIDRKSYLAEKYFLDCNCDRCSIDDSIIIHRIDNLLKTHNLLNNQKRFKESYFLMKEIVILIKDLIGDYHPYLTLLMTRLLITRLMLSRVDPDYGIYNQDVRKLQRQLLSAVRVTHGLDHHLYGHYRTLIVNLLRN